ncbi:endonuclease/exonuclease/phosphatase family protein [Rubripirellula reticaptiva]|uniref:Endonuclease/Exonuclease/phosphatase family protein n=1 Tax=Rubripirellula reticaptiva TaxID=2528013 RepID=A0A5C6EEU8_9BACT|nr:endonuclease/exonuclease/phosphatase family protein [Rubripirellula reticaptiva]TWU47025.1 Endonuclease/Exonuclease/phosphatase family protein [Rubripirellula reticaptiva]
MMKCSFVSAKYLRVGLTRLVTLCVLGLTMSPGLADDPIEVRVLSYNIHHGEGVDRKIDLARIARVVASVNADIVALQEVDQNVKRSGGVDQPAELAKLTAMSVVFGGNISLQDGHYGNAILSRWPIAEHVNRLLPNLNSGEQRGVIQAYVQTPITKTPLMILATHFDHRSDGSERFASAQAINELVMKHPQSPAILAGDLNDGPDSKTLLELKRHWTASSEKPMPTIPVAKPTKQIDFVLFHPKERWSVHETTVLDEAVASDHRAILTVLRFQEEQKQ